MIAQRFRPVAWVFGVAVAATALYTVSLRVAAERAKLDVVDQQIAETRREIRQLQTEMGARASLRQLERWNGETLALTTPGANQYLPNEQLLSRVEGASRPKDAYAPPPIMVSPSQRSVETTDASDKSPDPAPVAKQDQVAMLDEKLGVKAKVTVAEKPKPKKNNKPKQEKEDQ
jgi:hypothetical protein